MLWLLHLVVCEVLLILLHYYFQVKSVYKPMSSLLIPCPGEEKIVTTKSLTRRMMEPTKSRSFPLRHMLEHVARPKDANARPSPNGSHMGRFWHWRPRDKKCQTKQ